MAGPGILVILGLYITGVVMLLFSTYQTFPADTMVLQLYGTIVLALAIVTSAVVAGLRHPIAILVLSFVAVGTLIAINVFGVLGFRVI